MSSRSLARNGRLPGIVVSLVAIVERRAGEVVFEPGFPLTQERVLQRS